MGLEVAKASISLVPRGRHHGFPDDYQEVLRKTVKPGDRIDYEIVFLDTLHPLTPSQELWDTQRQGEHFFEGGRGSGDAQ